MLRDVKRRKVVKEYAKLRLQLNSLRYNTVLPKKLQEVAQKEIAALPTDSCHTKLHARCVLTSRPRGRWKKFRMSRIIWRHLADYNQISGAERAMW
ncbi:28S ribosomal protein S14, mitochondrial-like [Stegodyphus dumicola]|uniref:28S ribosomal protein S14, mitochondrial-like n=1 Tax=Stegodyphus dumicola TaxID=202533 RepID=UPI0015ABB094|nr:28S ribosomal protein S14, mitochondrial-like [Stegodyphus dumicola]